MSTATVGGRFQVVIPVRERTRLDIRAGDKLVVEAVGDHLEPRVIDARRLRGLGRALPPEADPVDDVRELQEECGARE